jgi:hypothetical protein
VIAPVAWVSVIASELGSIGITLDGIARPWMPHDLQILRSSPAASHRPMSALTPTATSRSLDAGIWSSTSLICASMSWIEIDLCHR